MAAQAKPTAVIGATGPTGRTLVSELHKRGTPVRAVSRSAEKLRRCFPEDDVENVPGDALDGAALRDVVRGCSVVVDCIGLPAERMNDHPATARNVARAARREGARCLQVSSFWSYLPLRELPLTEAHPRRGGNGYIRARREAEDVMLAEGAAVVHLPDFFGPFVHTSTMQRNLEEAAAGKTMNCLGPADTVREYVYVPDAMSAVADLIGIDAAYGHPWIVPGSGPLSGVRAARLAGEHLGRTVNARGAAAWLLKTLSLVSSDLRAFRPMIDHYARPIRYDAARLEGLLGAVANTPYEDAIPATLDWLTDASARRP